MPHEAMSPRQREKESEGAGFVSMERSAGSGSPESVEGQSRAGVEPKFWISIVGYGINFKRIQ
jgi:hypothetical protein